MPPSAPQTWTAIKALQTLIQTEVLVNSISPFDAFVTTDATKYGSTNAIYPGTPKDFTDLYRAQCHIIPVPERTHRRDVGGICWVETWVHIKFYFNAVFDWYQSQQTCINAADAANVVFLHHAELPNAPIVQAMKIDQQHGGCGYSYETAVGEPWQVWSTVLWLKQVIDVGPIIA